MSTEAQVKASMKWLKKNMRRIGLDVRNDYYNDVLLPFVQKHGYSVRGFILEALDFYMKYLEEQEAK